MKKNKIMILGALLLTLVATSCHEDADPMVAYAFDDNQSWEEARNSYAGKFRVFWKAMNQNYCRQVPCVLEGYEPELHAVGL